MGRIKYEDYCNIGQLGTVLMAYENYDSYVNRYTSEQLDLFRASIIVTDGVEKIVGVLDIKSPNEELPSPILIGKSENPYDYAILDELEKMVKE